MNHQQDTGPQLPAESGASLATNACLVHRIRSHDYRAVAYAISGPPRRLAWVIHAVSRSGNEPEITVEVSEAVGAHLLLHVVRNFLPRSGPIAAFARYDSITAPLGSVIESFPVDPYDVRHHVDFSWVGPMLVVSAREPNSFRRHWPQPR